MNYPSPDEIEQTQQAHADAQRALRNTKRLFVALVAIGLILGAISAFVIARITTSLDSDLAPSTEQR